MNKVDASALEAIERAKEAKLWIRQNQKPGAFPNIPPLLEARRLEYGIPDGAFKMQALYGRLLVHQIPQHEGDTYKGTSIIMTERAKDKERDQAPRGIIVSAGLSALDFIRSNGVDLGMIVEFVRLSPYEIECDVVGRGIPQYLKILQAGDLIACEDLAANLRVGATKLVKPGDVHMYEIDGQATIPQDPQLALDY